MYLVKQGQIAQVMAMALCGFMGACSLGQSNSETAEDADGDPVPAQQQAAAATKSAAKGPSTAKPAAAATTASTTTAAATPSAMKATAKTKTASKPAPSPTPAPQTAVAKAASAKASAKAVASAPAKAQSPSEKLIRFVLADVLNVHMSPRQDAPVVAKLARGSMFTVMYQGEWAKIGDGQWVLSRYLSRTQVAASGTRLATRK